MESKCDHQVSMNVNNVNSDVNGFNQCRTKDWVVQQERFTTANPVQVSQTNSGQPVSNGGGLTKCASHDHESNSNSVTSAKKRARDPLSHRIIEKRRRDRMNNCLTDLSKLIPSQYIKKTKSRVEKTEIVEMATVYLRQLQERLQQKTANTEMDLNRHFLLGFQECVSECIRFMVEFEGIQFHQGICSRLYEHLMSHFENLAVCDRKKSRKDRLNNGHHSLDMMSFSNKLHQSQSGSRPVGVCSFGSLTITPSAKNGYNTSLIDGILQSHGQQQQQQHQQQQQVEGHPQEHLQSNHTQNQNLVRQNQQFQQNRNLNNNGWTPPTNGMTKGTKHYTSYKFKKEIRHRFYADSGFCFEFGPPDKSHSDQQQPEQPRSQLVTSTGSSTVSDSSSNNTTGSLNSWENVSLAQTEAHNKSSSPLSCQPLPKPSPKSPPLSPPSKLAKTPNGKLTSGFALHPSGDYYLPVRFSNAYRENGRTPNGHNACVRDRKDPLDLSRDGEEAVAVDRKVSTITLYPVTIGVDFCEKQYSSVKLNGEL